MKKIGFLSIITTMCVSVAMNQPYEMVRITTPAQVQSIANTQAQEYLGQLLLQQQAQDAVHLELVKKIKGLLSDPAIVQQWQKIMESVRQLIHQCVSTLALNKNEATILWQLTELEKELLSAQGKEEISQDQLANLEFRLLSLAVPMQMAAMEVGMPSQEQFSLSFAMIIVETLKQALQKSAPVDFKAAAQVPQLAQPIVPEKMERQSEEDE